MAEGTDEPYTVSGLQAEVKDLQVTQDSAQNVRQSVQDFMDATSQSGAEVTYDAGNVVVKMGEGADTSGIQSSLNMTAEQLSSYKIEVEGGEVEYRIPEDQILSAQERAAQDIANESGGEFKIDGGEAYIEYTINEGDTLTSIEEATGVAKEKIAEMNGIDNLNEIDAGVTIKIPADKINVDESEVQQGAKDAMGDGTVDLGETTGQTHTTVEAGETDTDPAYSASEEAAKQKFSDNPIYADGTVNPNLSEGTNNIDEVYNQVDGEVKGRFASPFGANGTVNVTLDWKITNPTASISVGVNGGSATATISSAHMAEGGFADEPTFGVWGEDGPEYFIPVGAKHRNRGVELWAEAGQALGMFNGIPAFAEGGLVGGSSEIIAANKYSDSPTAPVSGFIEANADTSRDEDSMIVNPF